MTFDSFCSERMVDLASQVSKVGDQHFEAPTAETALAWLRVAHYIHGYGTKVDKLTSRSGLARISARPKCLFRGQSDYQWNLVPSLLRQRADKRRRAVARTQFMARTISSLLVNLERYWGWPPLLSQVGWQIPQHYNQLTTYLDWSLLPAVAVDFATRASNYEEGRKATVWVLHLTQDTVDDWLPFLPGPFFTRPVLQRGVFVEVPPSRVGGLEEKCWRVDFPLEAHHPATAVAEGERVFPTEIFPTERRLHPDPFPEVTEWLLKLSKWVEKRDPTNSEHFGNWDHAATEFFLTEGFPLTDISPIEALFGYFRGVDIGSLWKLLIDGFAHRVVFEQDGNRIQIYDGYLLKRVLECYPFAQWILAPLVDLEPDMVPRDNSDISQQPELGDWRDEEERLRQELAERNWTDKDIVAVLG